MTTTMRLDHPYPTIGCIWECAPSGNWKMSTLEFERSQDKLPSPSSTKASGAARAYRGLPPLSASSERYKERGRPEYRVASSLYCAIAILLVSVLATRGERKECREAKLECIKFDRPRSMSDTSPTQGTSAGKSYVCHCTCRLACTAR